MKKIIYGMLFASFVMLSSCSGSKELRATEHAFNGEWKLTNITSRGINPNYIKARIFDVGAAECFINSTWNFVANNHTGTITLVPNNPCGIPSQQQNISWFAVIPEDDGAEGPKKFEFKIIPNNMRPQDVSVGYALNIENQGEDSMVLYQTVPFEGSTIDLVYTYTKISQPE